MERRFSNQRLKYWVSTVAAVIDPTLPSPVASQSSTTTAVAAAAATPTNNSTTVVKDDTDESTNKNHGTYVPPQIPPLLVVPAAAYHTEAAPPNNDDDDDDDAVPTQPEDETIRNSESLNKNELDHQQHPPTITSHEEVLVFDDTHTNSSCDAHMNSNDSHSKNHMDDITHTNAPTATSSASSILFPRLQTWKKQATEAVWSATTTASTSRTGTVTTATATAAAAAAKASALMQQTSSWTTTTFTTTTNKTNPNDENESPPVVDKESHVHMEIDQPHDNLEEKKDDAITKLIIHHDDQTKDDKSDKISKDHPHTPPPSTEPLPSQNLVTSDTVVSTTPITTTAVTIAVAEEPPVDSPNDRETVLVESNDPPVTSSSPSVPPSSVTATTMSLSSTFRSSLQQWSTSVTAATKSSTVDNHNTNNNTSTISSLGLPKDVFRGRYSMTTSATAATATEPPESPFKSSTSPPTPVVENQSVRIGKLSSTADHWNQLSSQLQPHEYILLLGRGMLGVNLKQCYKLHHGVYVDYLVPHGSADRSKLVSVGDVITTVGKTDCLKNGTIATIPSIIANTARPVHITFATSGCFSTTNVPNPSMNYLDIAVALLHLASTTTTSPTIDTNHTTNVEDAPPNDDAASAVHHDRNEETTTSMTNDNTNTVTNDCPLSPVTGESNFSTACSDETIDTEDSMSLVQPTSFDIMNHNHTATGDDNDIDDIILPDKRRIPDLITTKFDIDHLLYPQSPPPSICQAYMSHVAKRNIDPIVFTLDYITATYHCSTNVRCVIQNALIVCIADRRRLAFVNRFIERQQEDKMVADQEIHTSSIDVVTAPLPAVKKWNVMLSLFMEMYNYVDLYDIIPLTKQRDIVKRIAYKYFLPTVHDNQVQSPPYDFHTIVSDASIRKLESTLKNTSETYPRTIFIEFQQATFISLTESVFLPFVISNDCARMRAYLRHTAPFVYVPISTVLSSICGTDESSRTRVHAQNYLSYCLVYLLCMMEQEEFGENDDLLLDQGEKGSIGRGARVENAASAICAAIRIKRQILPAISETQVKWNEREAAAANDDSTEEALNKSITALMVQLEQLWEIYVAPGVGSLVEGPNPTTAVQSLQMLRSVLLDLQKLFKSCSNDRALIEYLIDPILSEHLNDLANELIHDYAVRLHPRFRVHKFHEWVCDEIMQENLKHFDDDKAENNNNASSVLSIKVPAMGAGCVKRLLRKATFPVGITPHQPSHDKREYATSGTDADSMISQTHQCNADCAIVFGTRLDNGDATTDTSPIMTLDNIARYACQSVRNENEAAQLPKCLTPDEIPVTLESYAYVPLSRSKPFKSMQAGNDCSTDDWEISLVNFMLPHTDASSQSDEASSIYGVSLMFQYRERPCINGAIPTELSIQPHIASAIDASPVSTFDEDEIDSDTLEAMNWFDRMKKQQDKSLQDDPSIKSIAIGLVLVAQQNHIFAMRESLSLLLQKFTSQSDQSFNIFTLINRLGDLANSNAETPTDSLREFLEPFLLRGSQPWIERPIGSQAIEFSNHAGQQMIQSLPPIPMALMFITALLEQKIVLTSNRRSILLSVTTALQDLLNPLQWCHLILAHVPAAMASDLLQYPAPFILGLPSSDPGITEMLRELPPDITLIDLDIGRVILAPSFGHDVEFGRRSVSTVTNAGSESITPTNTEKNIKILRSQVLYLAQCLGNVFGNHLYPSTWCCDDAPILTANRGLASTSSSSSSQFNTLRTLCHNFIEELLAGTTSCCYWLEEAHIGDIDSGSTASMPTGSRNNNNSISTVATVLFDEDQFFHIKVARYRYGYTPLFPKNWMNDKTQILNKTNAVTGTTTGSILTPQLLTSLALSMNEFDYIIELLLRCQSMNVYIGTRQRSDMAYFTN